MTYMELFYKATRLIDNGEITLGEYEEITKPLDREIEQEPCDDAISRKAVIDLVVANHTELNGLNVVMYSPLFKDIKQLPSVNPKEPKWDRLYSWLNDMRLGIAPDETVTDVDERNERMAQADLLDEIMEWIEKAVWEKKSEDEDEQGTN